MRRLLMASIVVGLVAWLGPFDSVLAQQESADSFLARAKYVALGYDSGESFVSEGDAQRRLMLSAEDRAALVAIRKQFEKWQRYVLTQFPEQADLLVSVHVGRRVSVIGRTGIGGSQSPKGFGIQLSTPDDVLSVYATAGGRGRALVWRKQMPKGLTGVPAPLFERLRASVEAAGK